VPPNEAASQLADLLSAPLEQVIVALASGIGRSQAELDRYSIETQRRIDEDPVLAQYGLEATWYQIPRTELELKIAVSLESSGADTNPSGPAPLPGIPPSAVVAGRVLPQLPRLQLQPVNARYQNQFSYNTEAASTMHLEIVPVPPPASVATSSPRLNADEVIAIAEEAELVDAPGQTVLWQEQGTGWRRSVNFNPGMQAWFVVQSQEEEDIVRLRALIKVDDPTGDVIKTVREE
jgi:hypothetical protein